MKADRELIEELKHPNSSLDLTLSEMQMVEHRTRMFETPNSLYCVYSTYKTGLNRKSSKRWWRWQTSHIDALYLSKNGYFYSRRRIGSKWYGNSILYINSAMRIPAEEKWGRSFDKKRIYPMIQTLGNVDPVDRELVVQSVPAFVSPALQKDNLADFAGMVLDKNHTSKHWQDLIEGNCLSNIVMAKLFIGIVPDQIIENILNSTPPFMIVSDEYSFSTYRRALRLIHPIFAERLAKQFVAKSNSSSWISVNKDYPRNFDIKGAKPRDWTDFRQLIVTNPKHAKFSIQTGNVVNASIFMTGTTAPGATLTTSPAPAKIVLP